MALQFKKAIKFDAKGRIALIGPAGSGKSYTMLKAARALVGPDGKIAAVDTEHGSLSKYADLFDFDVIEPDSFAPESFLAMIREAERAGYDAFCTDSLSHYWMGKDGALEFVDNAKKRSSSRDDMAGWKDFRPHERAMIDAMIASPMHILCTMRTKTAYDEQVNERTGKKQRIKIGLAPVQREGLEYEFDLVGLMDDENCMIVDKTRCSAFAGKSFSKPGEKEFAVFRDWLAGAERPVAPAPPPVQQEQPRPQVVQPQPAEQPKPKVGVPAVDPTPPALMDAYKTLGGTDKFKKLKIFREFRGSLAELTGNDDEYYRILNRQGVQHSNEFKSSKPSQLAARDMYMAIQAAVAPVAKPYEVSDDDVPAIIGGQGQADMFGSKKEASYGTD